MKMLLLILCLIPLVLSQQVGTNQAETHPTLSIQQCTRSSCTTQQRSVVLDSNWRWTHDKNLKNCYDGNTWDTTLCPNGATCAQNCYIEGGDYPGTYGITASGNSLNLKFVTKHQYGTNIGNRVYLLQDEKTYQLFKLKNQEFSFDVDLSNLPCGLNGALYFVEMAADGAMTGNNKAGAKYGTGYCDAQCPHDIKWINGEANVGGWKPSPDDPNAGKGNFGACCNEMDIWEANSMATAYTPHVCSQNGLYKCNGTSCGDGDNRYGGVCDKDGCDFNSWRMGDKKFYGKGFAGVDSSKPFQVVTQFFTANNSTTGDLVEIRRIYVQNGKVIPNSKTTFSGVKAYDSVTESFCTDTKKLFNDKNDFATKGGLRAMGNSFNRGVVLVMSLWDDHEANMLWLDSDYPLSKSNSEPGVSRGPCATSSGKPTDVENNAPNSSVKFSNIKYGDIGSTYKA
jgi:cellulose 1,4-beta-cellobiosidase